MNQNNQTDIGDDGEKGSRYSSDHSTLRHSHESFEKEATISTNDDTASVRTVSEESEYIDEEAQRPNPLTPVATSLSNIKTKRRGFLSKFVLIPEAEEPREYPNKIKWTITAVVSILGSVAPLGSSIILPSLENITQELHTTTSTTNFSIGVYMLALGFFPLFWSSFSESLGRRPIYIVSFALMVLFNTLAAFSNSIAMFIVMRMLAGGSAASVQAVGAGSLSDIWHPRERGKAMGYFYLGPLCGPLLAPIIGGLLQARWRWRSTMWFMTIVAFVGLNLLFWCLPETMKETKSLVAEIRGQTKPATTSQVEKVIPLTRTSTCQSVKDEGKICGKLLKRIFWEPFTIVKYLRFPAVALTIYYASISFGSLYILQIAIQVTFSRAPYNFSSTQIGLSYLPSSIGYLCASVVGGRWVDVIMAREAKKANRYDENGELVYRPEDRMRENAWLAAILYPCALIWFGWTAEKGVFYVVPLIANFFFGFGSMLVFAMSTTMLTEFMPKRATSGIALNNLIRNIFSFIGSIVAEPLINALGDGWLFTGVGVICLVSSATIWAMIHFGPRWRKTMDDRLSKE